MGLLRDRSPRQQLRAARRKNVNVTVITQAAYPCFQPQLFIQAQGVIHVSVSQS